MSTQPEGKVVPKSEGDLMSLVNLTPHAISIGHIGSSGKYQEDKVIQPSGKAVRFEMLRSPGTSIDTIPVQRVTYGDIKDMPAPLPGVGYIVSMPLAQRLRVVDPRRQDIYLSDSTDAFRDAQGQILGVPRLLQCE